MVYSIRFLCTAVLRMQPTEPCLYHVWPGRETDAWNMCGLVDSCIQWVDPYMYCAQYMYGSTNP